MAAILSNAFWTSLARPAGSAGARLTLAASLTLVAAIGYADYLTGYDIRLAILYLVPIAWTTWRLGGGSGGAMALACALCWLLTLESTHPYSHPGYFYWEGAATGTTYLLVVVLLARLRQALELADARFITVLEGLDAAVLVEDERSGTLLYGNRRFREAFGAAVPWADASGEVKDARTGRWYLAQSRSLPWIDGRETVLREFLDITEAHRTRELIAQHREATHRTSRLVALGEFSSAIAHELNQPLTAIATYNNACLRLLQGGAYDPAELAAAMQKCRDQAKRAGDIIQRLREVLRQPVPARARLDLNEVAAAAMELAEPEAAEAGVEVAIEAADGVLEVRSDRLLVEQVALNLIRNAIESVQGLPPARRRVTVTTAPAAQGAATFAVTDQGEGVPEEVSPRLFHPFVTTKASGLGLGLSICRSVIESLGGSIRGGAAPGGGARFEFTLPGEAAEAGR